MEISSAGKRALAHDHGMNKFYGDVLSIGGVGTASEGEQPASLDEIAQTWSGKLQPGERPREKKTPRRSGSARAGVLLFEPLESPARDCCHALFQINPFLTNARQRIADQHIHDPAAAITRGDQNRAGRLFAHFANHLRIFAARGPGSAR